jgi:hypothetical protein
MIEERKDHVFKLVQLSIPHVLDKGNNTRILLLVSVTYTTSLRPARFQIFLSLPPRDFKKCKRVCLQWRHFVEEEILCKEQFCRRRRLIEDSYWKMSEYNITMCLSIIYFSDI